MKVLGDKEVGDGFLTLPLIINKMQNNYGQDKLEFRQIVLIHIKRFWRSAVVN